MPSGLLILFLRLDGVIKLVPIQPVIHGGDAGLAEDVLTRRGLGTMLIGATLLYAWPRTALVGAIVLTAYLGGAVAAHARIGSPLFSHTLFGVYLGVLAWFGLWLRDARLRARVW
ncbi:DoxX family protein [Falsiroseomonas sp. HC035]|uniref:DoxX family protein n=1 Tax=Falsiroseomonas sp. HC035 TaxID=3390999 RepID=UPI003D310004